MNQAFHITEDVLHALSDEDVRATCEGLREMELFHLPFPTVDVIVPTDAILRNQATGKPFDDKLGPEHWTRVTLDETCEQVLISMEWRGRVVINAGNFARPERFRREHDTTWNNMIVAARPWRDMLIAVLASRNIVKETIVPRTSKLARMGIGKAKPAKQTVTYIRLHPVLPADDDGKPSGTTRRPHLRRGHIRNQRDRYGHHKVWIAPIFVNADKDFVESRQAYAFIK